MSYPIQTKDDNGDYRYPHRVGALKSSLPKSVATLAGSDPSTQHITCSWVIAEKRFPFSEIHGFTSFEDASESVLNGTSEVLFVPAAYPKAYMFIQNTRLTILDSFVETIPALVYAGRTTDEPKNTSTLYLHPSPERLADEFLTFQQKQFCTSNEQVCQKLVADTDPYSTCVTNQVAADFFGLTTYKVLHQPIMPWIIFAKS